jgi:hypothetical protein
MNYKTALCCLLIGLHGYSRAAAPMATERRSPVTEHRDSSLSAFNEISEDELFAMAAHASADAKVAIAKELVDRKSARLNELFGIYIGSIEKVKVTLGAIEYESDTASELYRAVAYQKEKAERKAYYERTTKKNMQKELEALFGPDYDTKWSIPEVDLLLSALTKTALADANIAPQTLGAIFRTNGFRNDNYKRVKYFAEKYPTAEILATLASFKNSNDVLLLQRNMRNAYLAVSIFPHPSLFAFLKSNMATEFENADFQSAVTVYKSPQAKILLENICTKISALNPEKTQRDEKLFQLYSCIEKCNYKLYGPVLKKIDILLN